MTILSQGKTTKLPNDFALTSSLIENARARAPRLRDLSEHKLGAFLKRKGCIKHSTGVARGWKFWPLPEARAAWVRDYGNREWDATQEWPP